MDYSPKPLDTSAIKLPPDVLALIDDLARNTHEVWARSRLDEGWHWGPARNDLKKEHPSLVPYQDLSDSEKALDCRTAEQALKAALALGCSIRGPQTASAAPEVDSGKLPHSTRTADLEGVRSGELDGDMQDAREDAAMDSALREELELCRKVILPKYEEADRRAKRFSLIQRTTTIASAVFGTVAVLCAISQMIFDFQWGHFAEIAAVLIAAIGFALGIFAHLHERWLLERHKAERYRLLKFRRIVALVLKDSTIRLPKDSKSLSERVAEIAALDHRELRQWMGEESIPESVKLLTADGMKSPTVGTVIDYYLQKRLERQQRYFQDRASANRTWDKQLRRLPAVLFLGSVLAALLHFTLAITHKESYLPRASGVLLFLAAALPTIEAGIRSLRSGFEFRRNSSRFEAVGGALRSLAKRLSTEATADEAYSDLQYSEHLLEREHREWLRLMSEPEWSW